MKPIRCLLGWHDYEETGSINYHKPLTFHREGRVFVEVSPLVNYQESLLPLAIVLRCSRCGKPRIREPRTDIRIEPND